MASVLFPTPAPRPFFGRVESLRGLGALAVAGYHFAGIALFTVPLLPDTYWPHADAIQNGVRQFGAVILAAHAALMTFFVISGFVLRLSLEHGPQQPAIATTRFFLGRAFRIYPIIFVAIAITAAVAEGPVTVRELVANMLLFDVSLNGSLWALQVEMLMAPVIVALYFLERRSGPRALVVVALVTSALAFKPSWAGWQPLSTNLFAFVLGMLVPTIGRRLALSQWRFVTGTLIVAVFALLLPNPCLGRYSKFSAVFEAYAAFTIVSLVAYRQDLSLLKCLDSKPLRWLGLASGSYYVLHMTTVPVALAIAAATIPPAWSVTAPALVGVLVLSVWLIAIAPISLGTYYLIELPGIIVGRRCIRLLRQDARRLPIPQPIERQDAPRRAA